MKNKPIEEQIEDFITPIIWSMDENIFGRMAGLIMNLDPETLSTEQLSTVMSIIEDMESQDEMEESILKSKKSKTSHNRYSKKYARLNKEKIKKKKEKFEKAHKNKKKVMARSGRTMTGRNKTRYNTKEHTN